MSKSILKKYITVIIKESKGRLPYYVTKDKSGKAVYEQIKNKVLELAEQGISNRLIFAKILEEFSENLNFISKSFNIRSINSIKNNFGQGLNSDPNIPSYVTKNAEGKAVYEQIKTKIVNLAIKGYSNSLILDLILEEFSENYSFIPEHFSIMNIGSIKANFGPEAVNYRTLPKYVFKNDEGKLVYEQIKKMVLELAEQGISNRLIYEKILEEFSENLNFISKSFNIRSINSIKNNFGPKINHGRLPNYVTKNAEGKAVYEQIKTKIIKLLEKEIRPRLIYEKILEEFIGNPGFIAKSFNTRSINSIRTNFFKK